MAAYILRSVAVEMLVLREYSDCMLVATSAEYETTNTFITSQRHPQHRAYNHYGRRLPRGNQGTG
jgi:hypothetical protein